MHLKSSTRNGLLGYASYLVVQLAAILGLHQIAPRFYWLDDSQAQFLPTAWWMGTTSAAGGPVLNDPDLGFAGNYTVDMQYGALDPLHWVLNWLASRSGDLNHTAWIFATITLVLLGSGMYVLLRSVRARAALAAMASVGVGFTGLYLWFGSSWWPVLWSVAWLPWLWWAAHSRSRFSIPFLALSTWAVLAAGNPYLIPFALVVLVFGFVTQVMNLGGWRQAIRSLRLWARLAAVAAGGLIAAPTLLTALQLAPYMAREQAEQVVGNSGFAVPNLLDFAAAGPTTLPMMNWWGSYVAWNPALSAFMLTIPFLALVNWKHAVRLPLLWAPIAVSVLTLVASQLPTVYGPFRYPVRFASIFQVAIVVLAIAALTLAPALTKRRWMIAGAIVLLQGALSVSRSPALAKWHIVALVVVAVALIATMALHRARAVASVLIGLGLVAIAVVPAFLQVKVALDVQSRLSATNSLAAAARSEPYRAIPAGYDWGTSVASIRDQTISTDEVATVINTEGFSNENDRGWSTGILSGNANLFSSFRIGVGYAAAPQKYLNAKYVQTDLWGKVFSPGAETWLAEVPGTGMRFIDLYAANKVYLYGTDLQAVQEYLLGSPNWSLVQANNTTANLVEFERVVPLVGRVTLADGVDIDAASSVSGPSRLWGAAEESISIRNDVSSDARLVLRVPYWPGFQATLNGQTLKTEAVDQSLLQVDIPAGSKAGILSVNYRPIGAVLFLPCIALAAIAFALAIALAVVRRRARTPGLGRLVRQIWGFFWASGLAAGVDVGIYTGLTTIGLQPGVSNVVSSLIAVLLTFALVTRYAFHSEHRLRDLVFFILWYAVSISVFSVLVQYLHDAGALDKLVAKLVSLPLSFSVNFLFSRWLFSDRGAERAVSDTSSTARAERGGPEQ